MGVASDETLEVNLVNIAAASPAGTAASCSGTVTFTNAQGAAIGKAASFTVTGGQISSTSLPFANIGATGTRAAVLASVQQTLNLPSSTPCSLVFSLETYATATGETHVLPGNSATAGGGGPVGILTPGGH